MTTEPMVNVVRETVEMACYPGSQVYVSDSVVYDEGADQRFEVRIVTIKRPYSDG